MPEVTITPSNTKTKASPTRKIGKGIGNAFKSIGNIVGGLDFGNMLATANAFYTASQRDAKAKGIRAPKSYMANPYENAAIDELNKLHSDYYTVWAGNREAEGRAKSAIAQSGGLGAGQRMLAYMGMLNQTQQNNAKSMFDAQNINNELKAQAAKVKLAAGENSATRRQNAYHWDEDMLAKAHAARENMWETSAYDRQNALTQFFKNMWEKNQFDQNMSLYKDNQKIERDRIQAIIDAANSPDETKSKTQDKKPTLADQARAITTPAGLTSLSETVVKANPAAKVKQPITTKQTKPSKRPATKKAASKISTTKPAKASSNLAETAIGRPAERAFGFTPDAAVSGAIKERFPDATKIAR